MGVSAPIGVRVLVANCGVDARIGKLTAMSSVYTTMKIAGCLPPARSVTQRCSVVNLWKIANRLKRAHFGDKQTSPLPIVIDSKETENVLAILSCSGRPFNCDSSVTSYLFDWRL